VCFGKTAENAAKHLAKGRQIAVSGKLRTQKWTDKEGRERYTTEVVADEIKYLGSAGGERREEPERHAPTGGNSGSVDEIPFAREASDFLTDDVSARWRA
jgi:single-strand DNA-binding protein